MWDTTIGWENEGKRLKVKYSNLRLLSGDDGKSSEEWKGAFVLVHATKLYRSRFNGFLRIFLFEPLSA